MAIRESSVKFEWLPGMKDLVEQQLINHTAASAPCESIANIVKMDGRWSDLFCPSKTHIKNFVSAHFARKKRAAQHALDREGKRCYNKFSLEWLKREVVHRGMKVGNRKVPGCIKMLEKHDDEHEGKLSKYHSTTDQQDDKTEVTKLSFSEFKKLVCSRERNDVPLLEWFQKECAYQKIETGSRLREVGMCKLLYEHYIQHDGPTVGRRPHC